MKATIYRATTFRSTLKVRNQLSLRKYRICRWKQEVLLRSLTYRTICRARSTWSKLITMTWRKFFQKKSEALLAQSQAMLSRWHFSTNCKTGRTRATYRFKAISTQTKWTSWWPWRKSRLFWLNVAPKWQTLAALRVQWQRTTSTRRQPHSSVQRCAPARAIHLSSPTSLGLALLTTSMVSCKESSAEVTKTWDK